MIYVVVGELAKIHGKAPRQKNSFAKGVTAGVLSLIITTSALIPAVAVEYTNGKAHTFGELVGVSAYAPNYTGGVVTITSQNGNLMPDHFLNVGKNRFGYEERNVPAANYSITIGIGNRVINENSYAIGHESTIDGPSVIGIGNAINTGKKIGFSTILGSNTSINTTLSNYTDTSINNVLVVGVGRKTPIWVW